MARDRDKLPKAARRFLADERFRTRRHIRSTVTRFHQWLTRRSLEAKSVRFEHMETHPLLILRGPAVPDRVQRQRYNLVLYLEWLHEHRLLSFDPRHFRRRPVSYGPDLPKPAKEYLEELSLVVKASTFHNHLAPLKRFHRVLRARRVPWNRVRRRHIVQWLLHLAKDGLGPATRSDHIAALRRYLRWLVEHGRLRADPEKLLTRADFPKLPTYLPRPLPPDIDRELQSRWEASDKPLHLGLRVMRRTGLRAGELLALDRNSLRIDECDRAFVKVPLGKLDNERLVPVDASTVELIRKLNTLGPEDRQWLVPGTGCAETRYRRLWTAMHESAAGLESDQPISSHRLRHTYATELLNGGMSLVAVAKLLGHRSVYMTLRYAAITLETVYREYEKAIGNLEARYGPQSLSHRSQPDTPVDQVRDVIRWLDKLRADQPEDDKRIRRLRRRLRRVVAEIERLANDG